jgi:transcriptional regulator with XRE-family HTH domain
MALRGLSQEYVAERLGVSQATVSRWLDRLASPTKESALKIADHFDIPVRAWVGLDDAAWLEARGWTRRESAGEACWADPASHVPRRYYLQDAAVRIQRTREVSR